MLNQPLVEITGSGTVYRAFVSLGGNQPVALLAHDGEFYWVHADHLGTARKLTRSDTTEAFSGEYDPQGQKLTESNGSLFNNHRFTGYEWDWGSNLHYAKARMYAHQLGRFLQADPLSVAAADASNSQSFNRYSYVENDPVNLVDPYGLFAGECNLVRSYSLGESAWVLQFARTLCPGTKLLGGLACSDARLRAGYAPQVGNIRLTFQGVFLS